MQKIRMFFYTALISVSFMLMINVIDIFTESYAQTGSDQPSQQQQQGQQSTFTNTLTINLSKSEDILVDDGKTFYRQIENINTTVPELQGMEVASGVFSQASVDGDTISVTFPAQMPDPQNIVRGDRVLDVNINLDINFEETKPDGLKIYYAGSGFAPNNIGEFEVIEGVLEQTSKKEAVLTLLLEQE